METLSDKLLRLYNSVCENRDNNNISASIEAMKEILTIAPNWEHGWGWFELAGLYIQSSKFEKAAECYANCLSFPGQDDPLQNYCFSNALAGCGKLDESFEKLVKALSQDLWYNNQKQTLSSYWKDRILDLNNHWKNWNGNLFERLYKEFPEETDFWKETEGDGKTLSNN